MLELLITGSSGRMGQSLIQAAAARSDVKVTATHDLGADLDQAIKCAQCVIDFTVHNFTEQVIRSAVEHGKPLVIGTTGHSAEERASIEKAAEKLPIVFASNYSVGVNTLFWLTRQAARILSQENYDVEIVEMHHHHKIDAPSGTARTLLDVLHREYGTSESEHVVHGRVGNIGPRKPREIGMHTLRGGDVVGDHSVIFAADGERVELSHKASSRQTFANGAIHAAIWLQDKPPGLYDMRDVLGLSDPS
ncbi:MAG: 4-hydroxy-tetrahydrodipicolinate reductase [Luteolibacter sp.]